MPPYHAGMLLSDMPTEMTRRVCRPLPKIPDQVLKNVKMIDFVGYAPNPRTFRRNQEFYSVHLNAEAAIDDEPLFRSEKNRAGTSRLRSESRNSNFSIDSVNSGSFDTFSRDSPVPVKVYSFPRHYRKVEIKYSR